MLLGRCSCCWLGLLVHWCCCSQLLLLVMMMSLLLLLLLPSSLLLLLLLLPPSSCCGNLLRCVLVYTTPTKLCSVSTVYTSLYILRKCIWSIWGLHSALINDSSTRQIKTLKCMAAMHPIYERSLVVCRVYWFNARASMHVKMKTCM